MSKPFGTAFTDALSFGVLTAVHLPDSKEPVPQGILDQLPPQERDHAITLGVRACSTSCGPRPT